MSCLTKVKDAVPWAAAATVPFALFKSIDYWARSFSDNLPISYLGSAVIGGAAMGLGAAIEKILSLDTYPFEELTYGVIAGTVGGLVESSNFGSEAFFDTAWKTAAVTALTILIQKKMEQEAVPFEQNQNGM